MKAKQIVLASRPKGLPSESNFRFEEIELKNLKSGEVLLKPLYVSVDPYMRGRMSDAKSYAEPFAVNNPIVGGVVAIVEESESTEFKKGDRVLGMLPWATFCVHDTKGLQKIDAGIPESYYLGIVGMPGLTAYFGMTDICNPKKDETVVVSAAAGAVGSIAGQIAKIRGCRVVGIAGSDEKIKMLKEKFGFDEVINYKAANINTALEKACPQGIDCYYDNVGGDITDAVIAQFNRYARMALCGQIALYNETSMPMGPRILPSILKTSTLIKGFIVSDYQQRFPEGIKQLAEWVKDGKLKYNETIINGFEKLPDAFLGLFSGANTGKMIVKI